MSGIDAKRTFNDIANLSRNTEIQIDELRHQYLKGHHGYADEIRSLVSENGPGGLRGEATVDMVASATRSLCLEAKILKAYRVEVMRLLGVIAEATAPWDALNEQVEGTVDAATSGETASE